MSCQQDIVLNQLPSQRARAMLRKMTLMEKLGQLAQVSGNYGDISDELRHSIQQGRVSSIINEVDVKVVNELQRIATKESRLGIPLLIGRDVIHGFKTIFPIPLGQAATWCTKTVQDGARVAAIEAASQGVNWTFAPMIDITRDPRWGRIAESLGEDPFLCAHLGAAMVKGFQTESLNNTSAIASCAKHFAGYGYSESGRDYNFANISENELHNTVFPPFKLAAHTGVATFMTSFSDLNGIPGSGNSWLTQDILREQWNFAGFVVSDWDSIKELQVHGFTEDDKHSACVAANAGVDMEMASSCYSRYLPELVAQNAVHSDKIDEMALRILELKYALGLFDNPYTESEDFVDMVNKVHLRKALDTATKSCVLLKNNSTDEHRRYTPQCTASKILPLDASKINNLAVIGPLADDGYEQLGTWIFDGEEQHSITCKAAFQNKLKSAATLSFVKGLETSRDESSAQFEQALTIAKAADAAILVLGEESILSGEAHCRTNLDLPGAQIQLIEKIATTNTPIILVVMAGRPLTLAPIIDKVDAILYAWHPGTMGGQAIADLIFGDAVPSGKLPVTFPRVVGQIPIYYGQKHGGRPASNNTFVHQNDFPVRASQTSLGMSSTHIDTHYSPLFPFGFGLSFADIAYSPVEVDSHYLSKSNDKSKVITATVTLKNKSDFDAEEVVQMYIRDLVSSATRPVKELKGFKRVKIEAGRNKTVSFELTANDLGFYGPQNKFIVEVGKFRIWIGPNSEVNDYQEVELIS